MANINVQCGSCGAHFALNPSGDIAGTACSECGGTRFFMDQPSPTKSDGALRDMVDPISQKDQGGNPLGEGTIMGDDGERPAFKRDNFMHSKVAGSVKHAYPGETPMLYEHSDIPEGMSARQYLQQPRSKCTNCRREFIGQGPYCFQCLTAHPELQETSNQPPHWLLNQREMRPETLNMEPYPGLWSDEHVAGILDDVWHGVKDVATNPVVDVAGLAALNLIPGVGEAADAAALGDAAAGAGEAAGAAGAADTASAAPSLMNRVLNKGVGLAQRGAVPAGATSFGKGFQDAEQGQGGMPSVPAGGSGYAMPGVQPQGLQQFGSTDIPFLLTADMDTPHSVKSVDEQHDDPEKQDQKEFNDGDKSPSNHENPNNEDSGASGEDGVRNNTPGYGFGPNSPGIQHMQMLMPLLLHYIENGISGADDPNVQALHQILDQENPGYLENEDPNGDQLIEALLQKHKSPGHVHARLADTLPSGLPAVPTPTGANTLSVCPRCGGPLTADGSCPQCGFKAHPQGGEQAIARTANHQGPTTPEQIAAVQQLLMSRHKNDLVPDVPLHPENYSRELAEIQGNPNVAPLVDPSEAQPAPPQPQMDPSGAMPVPDPSQPGGGMQQPMQPMSNVRTADANSRVKRCPFCGSGTTTINVAGDPANEDSLEEALCHSCHKTFKIAGKVILAELPNPLLAPPSPAHESLIWKDSSNQELQEGQTYTMKSSNYPVPDEVEVVYKHPNELGLKLVGSMGDKPDFKITADQAQKYSFEPNTSISDTPQPIGGTPGMEQIPETSPTTDELSDSYPNRGTVSAVLVAGEDDDVEPDEDLCTRCGNTWITHTAASPTRTMHECNRCGSAWETSDEDFSRTANTNLDWIMHDSSPYGGDFWSEMERVQAGRTPTGTGSRNLGDIAAKDERLARIRNVLDANPSVRDMMEHTAGRHYSPKEQRALVNERGTARNSDRLDLTNTHYETRYDPTGKANGENAPDEHLVFGL